MISVTVYVTKYGYDAIRGAVGSTKMPSARVINGWIYNAKDTKIAVQLPISAVTWGKGDNPVVSIDLLML